MEEKNKEIQNILENICGFLSTGGNTMEENYKNCQKYASNKLKESREKYGYLTYK